MSATKDVPGLTLDDIEHALELGFSLVPLPLRVKVPPATDWPNKPITTVEQARAEVLGENAGIIHRLSGTFSLDIDDLEGATQALARLNINLPALLDAPGPKIKSPRGIKPIYRVPEGVELKRHALAWVTAEMLSLPKGEQKLKTIFELRAGNTQDVLPGSVHPSGAPYEWIDRPESREDIPMLPGSLLALAENWDELKPVMLEAAPGYVPPPPRERKPTKDVPEGESVIDRFNADYSPGEIIERYRYKSKGKGRWIAPGSSSGIPGVVLLEGDDGLERVYSHHGSDPLNTGHAEDAFGAWLILKHDGDLKEAVKDAAELLGMSFSSKAEINVLPSENKNGFKGGALNSVNSVKSVLGESSEKNNSTEEEETAWEKLLELPPTAQEVPTLAAELIPEPLRAWIDDAAERACVHREFIAVPALVSAGALIGRRIAIHPKKFDDWRVVANLWGAIVGPPSVLKSMAIEEGTLHLRRLTVAAREDFEDNEANREAEIEILKLELANLKKGVGGKKGNPASIRDDLIHVMKELKEKEEGGAEKRYLTNDATIEKLGELLRKNPRGLLMVRDELMGFLKTLDKPGRENERPFYLEAWNGTGSHSIDRIGRGSLFVPALTLSILGGIQPGKLMSYIYGALEGEGEADGLLQRFQLLVWPDQPPKWVNVDRYPNTTAKNRAYEIYKGLDDLDLEKLGLDTQEADIPALHFDDDAQVLYDEWRDVLMHRIRTPEIERSPAYQSHLAKYPSLFASLALIFHLIDVADNKATGRVSLTAAALAMQWCVYLEAHARKIYAPELNAAALAAHALAEKIKETDVEDRTPLREIYRRQWPGLKTAEQVGDAIAALKRCNWARVESVGPEGGGPGRHKDVLRLHPELRSV